MNIKCKADMVRACEIAATNGGKIKAPKRGKLKGWHDELKSKENRLVRPIPTASSGALRPHEKRRFSKDEVIDDGAFLPHAEHGGFLRATPHNENAVVYWSQITTMRYNDVVKE